MPTPDLSSQPVPRPALQRGLMQQNLQVEHLDAQEPDRSTGIKKRGDFTITFQKQEVSCSRFSKMSSPIIVAE